MPWLRIAFWSASGILALLILAIGWLFLADLGVLKPHIERWASEATGRQISIDGPLRIDLAGQSTLIAEDIVVSNAAWADDPEMLSVERVEILLDLGSLWSGPIVVDLIDIDGAKIALQKPPEGPPNWVFAKGPAATEREPVEDAKGIILRQIDIDDVALRYTAADRPEPINLYIQEVSQRHRDDDMLRLTALGSLNDREVKLDGEIGTWSGLMRGKEVMFSIGARLDKFTLNADGHIDDLLSPHRPRINFTAAAPDINDLLDVLGVKQRGQGDIDLVGSLTPQEQRPLVLEVAGRVGRLEIDASGEFSDLRDLHEVDLKLLATGEDVRPILAAFGMPQTKPSPFMINVIAARQGTTFVIEQADMVFGQAKFGLAARLPEFPRIDESVIHLEIDGPDIERFRDVFNLPGAASGPFSAGLTIDVADDGYELVNLDLQTSLGRVHADGRLGDAPEFYGTQLQFELDSDSLSRISTAYGIHELPDAQLKIRGAAEFGPEGIRSVTPLTVLVNESTMQIDGLIKPVKGLLGSDFEFELGGPDLAVLIGAFTASNAVPTQAYSLDGQLQIRDDGYRFREVSGKLGTSDINIDGLLVPRRGIIGSRFNFAARGAAFTELTDPLGDIEVRPGPYELSGSVLFQPDLIDFSAIKLTRATGEAVVDLELGMPVSRRWMNVDIKASGPNVQSLLRSANQFEADAAPFLINIEGEQRGAQWLLDQLTVSVGVAKLTGQGTLDLADDVAATDFRLSLDVPNVADLGTLDGYRMREQSFSLDTRINGADNELQFDGLSATFGPSDIVGDVRYRLGDVPRLDVELKSNSIVVAPLLESKEEPIDPAPKFADGRLIPNIAIPFDAMARIDVGVAIDIGEFRRDLLHMRDIVVRAELQNGALHLSEFGFQAKAGALRARGRLVPTEESGEAAFELVARDFALGMSDLNRDTAMTGNIDIKLESSGADLRTLAGNASGIFFLNSRGGRMMNNRWMHALYGNVLEEIIGTINPFSKDEEYTDFECVIMPVSLEAGLLTSQPNSLIATDKIQIVTKSEVDLKTESLQTNIRTAPKKGISISAGEILNPYIKVVGTLAEPRLAVDETGVLLSGGAAVATGGLSVLARAAWTRLAREKDPCEALAEEGIEELGDQFPNLTVTIVDPPSEAVPTATESIEP